MGADDPEHRSDWLCGVYCRARLPFGTHCSVGWRDRRVSRAGDGHWALRHRALMPADAAQAGRKGFRTTAAILLASSRA